MTEQLILESLIVGPLQVNCFLVACPTTRLGMVVDPGDNPDLVLRNAHRLDIKVSQVLNTHGHFDHVGGNRKLISATGAELLIHKADLPLLHNAQSHAEMFGLQVDLSPEPSRFISHGDQVEVGNLSFEVIHVPGHSPGGIALYGQGHLFVGDILFSGSIGRTDLPGGDHDLLIKGIREHLLILPDQTIVHTGHGPDTTLGRERSANPFLGGGNAWGY